MLGKDLKGYKVACICNQNNMFFGLVRYLRDAGIDAELFLLNNEQKHFHPSYDSFSNDYLDYVKSVKWGSIDTYFRASRKKIRNELSNYSFIIATDSALPFLRKAKIQIDVIFPAGADLSMKSITYKAMPYYAILINPALYLYSKAMENAFKTASCINVESSVGHYKERLRELDITSKNYYFGCPMIYTKEFNTISEKDIKYSDAFNSYLRIRKEADLLIFYHNRVSWSFQEKEIEPYHNTGTDVVIKGFARFINRNRHLNARFVFLEYGKDVSLAKKLISELEISDYCHSYSLLPRKEVLNFLKLSDFGCGQFHVGGLGGGTTWETLAMGKPLLHFIDEPELHFNSFDSVFPFVNVKTDKDICFVLEDFVLNPQKYVELGNKARKWFAKNIEEDSIKKWVELIKLKAEGKILQDFIRRKVKEQISK